MKIRMVFVTLALLAGSVLAAPAAPPGSPPLELATQGHFYAGGREIETGARPKLVEQMFVEYQIPARQTHRYPVVLIHGGGLTGSYWVSTPDGREGWASWLVRRGYAVYVVDLPTAGRSANGHPGRPTAEADAGLVDYTHPGFPVSPLAPWMSDPTSDAMYQFRAGEQPLREPMAGRNDLIIEGPSRTAPIRQRARRCWTVSVQPSSSRTRGRGRWVG